MKVFIVKYGFFVLFMFRKLKVLLVKISLFVGVELVGVLVCVVWIMFGMFCVKLRFSGCVSVVCDVLNGLSIVVCVFISVVVW